MAGELDFIAALRAIATDPGARGLNDDVAVLDGLVLTHDLLAEGVHYLPDDPPESVGEKLVAVTLSDLAGKGAQPVGALLGYCLGDDDWDRRFLVGLKAGLQEYGCALLGGDTIAGVTQRVLGLTAIGRTRARVPDRRGASAGDGLWLIGTLGDSAAGLAQLRADAAATGALVEAYRRPRALLREGQALAPYAQAAMDVSDGLLIDVGRLALASGLAAKIELETLPLSPAFRTARGEDLNARLFAATGGDDYALLAAIPSGDELRISLPAGAQLVRIGQLSTGSGLSLSLEGRPVPLPEHLGYEHRP